MPDEPEVLEDEQFEDAEPAPEDSDVDPAEEEALIAFLSDPTPAALDEDDDEDEDDEPSPAEQRRSAVEQLEALLAEGVHISQLELRTAADGSLISCERATL